MEWDPSYINWPHPCQNWGQPHGISNWVDQTEASSAQHSSLVPVQYSSSTAQFKRSQLNTRGHNGITNPKYFASIQAQHAPSTSKFRRNQLNMGGHNGIANSSRIASPSSPGLSTEATCPPSRTERLNDSVHSPVFEYASPSQHPASNELHLSWPRGRQASRFCPNFYVEQPQQQLPYLQNTGGTVLPHPLDSRARWEAPRNNELPPIHHQQQVASQMGLSFPTEPYSQHETKPHLGPVHETGHPACRPMDNSTFLPVVNGAASVRETESSSRPSGTPENRQKQDRGSSSNRSCVVCGDRASGFHYNAQTCEGCKSFFKRASSQDLILVCKGQFSCEMTREKRTRCKACRLNACLRVGMTKEGLRKPRVKARESAVGLPRTFKQSPTETQTKANGT